MIRKDYNLIAAAIKEQWLATVAAHGKGQRSLQVHNTAARIATAIEQQNANFDRERFLAACGIEV